MDYGKIESDDECGETISERRFNVEVSRNSLEDKMVVGFVIKQKQLQLTFSLWLWLCLLVVSYEDRFQVGFFSFSSSNENLTLYK